VLLPRFACSAAQTSPRLPRRASPLKSHAGPVFKAPKVRNPRLNYYGQYYRSALIALLRRINAYILRWARKKYKRLRAFKRAIVWWRTVVQRDPTLFWHWSWTTISWMAG
jgi:hypothetical protein